MLSRVFSRGQAIRVGLTSTGIRATATPTLAIDDQGGGDLRCRACVVDAGSFSAVRDCRSGANRGECIGIPRWSKANAEVRRSSRFAERPTVRVVRRETRRRAVSVLVRWHCCVANPVPVAGHALRGRVRAAGASSVSWHAPPSLLARSGDSCRPDLHRDSRHSNANATRRRNMPRCDAAWPSLNPSARCPCIAGYIARP